MELHAIRWLLDRSERWDYFVNLSGQDYPLKSRTEIIKTLSMNPSLNYVQLQPIDDRHGEARRRLQYVCFELAGRVIRTRIPLPRARDFQVEWKGSAWHILTREFCEWIVRTAFVAKSASYLRRVLIPDEFLMQCLLMNSPFAPTAAPDYRRLILWQGSPHPVTLTMEHASPIARSDALFARKCDETVDRQVLECLRERTGEPAV